MSDPDAVPLTDDEWEAVKPAGAHRSPAVRQAAQGAYHDRFDADVLAAALKVSGKGGQTRVNEVMREWIKTHSPA